jgi:selT/selW/selH-like putative selenoprotein
LAAKISDHFDGAEVKLIDGGRGVFTVIADGNEVWNKHKAGSFPEEDEVVRRIAAL